MEKYDHKKIEQKWQKIWAENNLYKTSDKSEKPKFYVLDMFPYPSGAGLHVGHPKGYIATDVVARFKMLNGFNVLHPMGWDAFGLPAENYAIKNKIHPRIAVEKNIDTFKKQLEKFGFTYDWAREISTTDQEYYKWTQWIFLKMFEKGLAYESEEPVNWCANCKTVLANEDLENGKCERCGSEIIQKKLRQWVLKMTEYADKLLYDLDNKDLDWEELIKKQQRDWIGKSEGAIVQFSIAPQTNADETQTNAEKSQHEPVFLEVFTTRLDTIFGCTFALIAPEHNLLQELKPQIENWDEVEKYISEAKKKSELQRISETKEKTGIEIKGIKVINPFTKEEIPLFASDFVLAHYGTGAVMAVPAHDQRDFDFAKKYNLQIKFVVASEAKQSNNEKTKEEIAASPSAPRNDNSKAFTDDGILINSSEYNNLTSAEAREKMAEWLEKNNLGKKKINYKMRDWVFSRQRYWGEPIPIIHCKKCGVVGVPEKDLPVKLPKVENYEPSGTGESPLANILDWVNTTCPKCGGHGKRETNTMPQWAGSCWYFLRYIDPKNSKALIDENKEKYWMPVDLYVGGAEHATRHLLYARFWHKFLFDIGVVLSPEPFKKLVHVGLINAEDGRKMSKRWNNVINPDYVIDEFGADSMRLYEMFMGPFTQNIAWSTAGVKGTRGFLEKVWKLSNNVIASSDLLERGDLNTKIAASPSAPRNDINILLNKTIKKVGEDIENFRFNTAVSALMILVNEMEKEREIASSNFKILIKLLSPFAPHIAEELWHKIQTNADSTQTNTEIDNKYESIFLQKWPEYDKNLIKDEKVELVVQINGKVRGRFSVASDISEEGAKKIAFEDANIQKWLEGKNLKKVIFVKGKLLSIVI